MRGDWVREPRSSTVFVFIHGILSSGETAWGSPAGTTWPQLLFHETKLTSTGIYVFTYETGFRSGSYRLGDAVDALKEYLRLDGVLHSHQLCFVCHSMGGIVARKYIVERSADLLERGIQVGLFLVASPSLGSSYANLLGPLAQALGHSQAAALRFGQNNDWLNDLDKEFQNLKESGRLDIVGKELVEDQFVVLPGFWRKQIVQPFSGARYFGEPLKVPMSNHFSIAKPDSPSAMQHRLLVQFALDMIRNDSDVSSEVTASRQFEQTWGSRVQSIPQTPVPPAAYDAVLEQLREAIGQLPTDNDTRLRVLLLGLPAITRLGARVLCETLGVPLYRAEHDLVTSMRPAATRDFQLQRMLDNAAEEHVALLFDISAVFRGRSGARVAVQYATRPSLSTLLSGFDGRGGHQIFTMLPQARRADDVWPQIDHVISLHLPYEVFTEVLRPDFDMFVDPADGPARLEDVVLSEQLHRQVVEIFNTVKELLDAAGQINLAVLLRGPHGTGKSLSARVIAGELGLPMFQLNALEVLSADVSDTGRRLQKAIDIAAENVAILLVEGVEAFYGGPRAVPSGEADNSLVSVLGAIVRFKGIVLFTTNHSRTLHPSFILAMDRILDFEFPTPEQRAYIWRRSIGPDVPIDQDVDFDLLSREFPLTGAAIKTAVSSAIAEARGGRRPLIFDDLSRAARQLPNAAGESE